MLKPKKGALVANDITSYISDNIKSMKSMSIIEICDRFNTTPQMVRNAVNILYRGGKPVTVRDTQVVYTATPEVASRVANASRLCVRIGLMSDLHFGAKSCQLNSINEFVNTCYDEGITEIFISGDLTDGVGVYEGQMYEQTYISADDQVDCLAATLPIKQDLKYYFILGNHDDRVFRKVGASVGQLISLKRPDMIYVGDDWGTVRIGYNTDIALHHPSGVSGRVLSSRVQRTAQELAMSELSDKMDAISYSNVRLLSSGHLHVCGMWMQGPYTIFQAGCFAGENGLTKRMGIRPVIGGWDVSFTIEDNLITNINPIFRHYREER